MLTPFSGGSKIMPKRFQTKTEDPVFWGGKMRGEKIELSKVGLITPSTLQ
jgi:hypothetical protein